MVKKGKPITKHMPKVKSERGPADRSRISLKEDYEKEYWKKKFRVSGQALAGAVRAVGRSSKKVEGYLKEHSPGSKREK